MKQSMTNAQVQLMLRRRTALEDEIIALGGKIPNYLSWDFYGELRNNQLQDLVEKLRRRNRK